MTQIRARAIYADPNSTPMEKSDPPQGCVMAYRYHSGGREYKIGDPWPEFAAGEQVEIETTNHYIWHGTVESRVDEDTIVFRPSGPKVAMPLPPYVEGQSYLLPWMSGDAWLRNPKAGTVILIGEQPYKVIGTPKKVHGDYNFVLRPVSGSEYATRPGTARITDLTDPNPGLFHYDHNVGRIIKIGAEFLHITSVVRQAYGSGEGDEIFGYHTIGKGHFVPSSAKAAKLYAAWQKARKIRDLEHSLKVANQDLDYGGNPDAIPGIQAELEALRGEKR